MRFCPIKQNSSSQLRRGLVTPGDGDRGTCRLVVRPGEWRLFAVTPSCEQFVGAKTSILDKLNTL